MVEPIFKVKERKTTDSFAEFVIEPLEPGYGFTLGHALRRVLLTTIPGAAVTSVKINGVKHKFSQVPGLKENVIDLLLNIKNLHIRLPESIAQVTVTLSAKGQKTVTGADIEESEGVEVVNKDHYLGSLSGDKAKLEMELIVEKGYGYSLAEERSSETVGDIQTDAIFSPVQRVNYAVETTRVGRRTNMDKLVLQIWTNGSITPQEALTEAAKVLTSYFMQIFEPKATPGADNVAISPAISDDLLKLTVDELDLPTRIYNSLRNGGIETLGQLLGTQKKDLVAMRNMGAKSIAVIEEKLREKGISLTV